MPVLAKDIDRRSFLKTSAAAAGGLLVGFYLPGSTALGARQNPASRRLNAFVHVGSDDVVTIIIHKPENGQGTVTSLSMLVAEELECDWSKIRWEFAPIDRVYGFPLQGTFGSTGVRTSWQPLRQAGATAREMLLQAAANRWDVDPGLCRAENGSVLNTRTGARLRYGQLADAAAELPAPDAVTLKDPADFRIIGKPTKRLDTPEKIRGEAVYGIDVRRPEMLYAVVARCPVIGGRVRSFRAEAAERVPGVERVLEIPEGIAVVAGNTWAAIEGRKALQIEWDEGPNRNLNSRDLRTLFADLAASPGAVARNDGDARQALASASTRIDAVYEAPYLAHATMEPPTCAAEVDSAGGEVWSGTQIPGIAHTTAAEAAGLDPEQVRVHTLYIGGGFGSRGGGPVYAEAVRIARAAGRPVNLVYTREDDIRNDRYRPASYVRFEAGLDAEGWPTTWTASVASPTWMPLRNGIDREGVAGIADADYDIPNRYVEYRAPDVPIPTNYWRSVGHSQNTYFTECFIDEMAAAGGKDPVEFRRRLLTDAPRLLNVLDVAAERAGWTRPAPPGRYRGVAAVSCFGSHNAQIAEISLENRRLRVHRVVCAIDCGQVVNPDGVVQQMQSGIVYGLSAALKGEITFEGGRVVQDNFDRYDVLRISEMPEVEVHIVPSPEAPGGIGEVGTPAIAPAVANAVFSATGRPVRRLPVRAEDLA